MKIDSTRHPRYTRETNRKELILILGVYSLSELEIFSPVTGNFHRGGIQTPIKNSLELYH